MVSEPPRKATLMRDFYEVFDLDQLQTGHDFSKKPYLEFLHAPSSSVGLYALSAGSRDNQQPHTEDEVYYVLEGEARLWVGDEDLAVKAGTVVFVAAGVEHRFHSIEQDLRVLVFFAPAEYSRASESLENTIQDSVGKGGTSE